MNKFYTLSILKNIVITFLIITLGIVSFLLYNSYENKKTDTPPLETNTPVTITPETQDEKIHSMNNGKVDVFRRMILGEDKYFLKISTGFESICTWNYLGGNHGVRYIETTTAKSDGIHTMLVDNMYNFSVQCIDDSGLKYEGNFIDSE